MKQRILLSTGIALSFLIGRWWTIYSRQGSLFQIDINKTLLALGVAGILIGIAGGVLSALFARRLAGIGTAFAVTIAALAALEMFGAQDATLTAPAILSSVMTAVLAFIVFNWLAPKLPAWLLDYRCWWLAAMSGFCATLALSANVALDSTGSVSALLGALSAAVFAVAGFRARTHGDLLTAAAFCLLLISSAVISFHVPQFTTGLASSPNRPSILLFTIDTLRSDHVGAYGYAKARTPNLDRLARQGVLFKQTVTANVFTGPSHTSILTGLLPVNHKVIKNIVRIPADVPTLADILHSEGYLTAAFVSSFTTQDGSCGLPSRFQYYDDDIRAIGWLPKAGFEVPVLQFVEKFQKFTGLYSGEYDQTNRPAGWTSQIAIDWLEQNGDKPYFVWVHLFDPHLPYRPPPEYVSSSVRSAGVSGVWYGTSNREKASVLNSPEKFAAMLELYDAEIAYADHELGRVLEVARKKASGHNLVVIGTSDHGEAMGEHDLYWNRDLHDPTVLVPLIMSIPDGLVHAERQVEAQVRLIDIAPTVLNIVGLESSLQFDGQSLMPWIQGNRTLDTGPAVGESFPSQSIFPAMLGVRTSEWKYLQRFPGAHGEVPRRPPIESLYYLPTDKRELTNLIESGHTVPNGFYSLLQAQLREDEIGDDELNETDRNRLKSLGYIQ